MFLVIVRRQNINRLVLVIDTDVMYTLLAFYAGSRVNSLPTFRDNLLVPLSSTKKSKISWNYSPLGCSETSVRNYHYTLPTFPEQGRSH